MVLFLLSCARPALGAPAEPAYLESYPAVAWQEIGKEETDSLQLLWYGEYPPTKENIRAGKVNSFVSILHGAGHPLLDSLLPGSHIYHVAEQLLAFELAPVSITACSTTRAASTPSTDSTTSSATQASSSTLPRWPTSPG